MSKRNITYIKPEEPGFLTKLKAEAGYKQGDTIETKKAALPAVTDEDTEDREEEQPVVVVLNPGDLSAEEVAKLKAEQKKDEEEAPANLEDRVLFRAPAKRESEGDLQPPKKKSKVKGISNTKLLSFDDQEDDDYS